MVSFSSSLHVDRDAGVAAFASSNIHYALAYRPRDITVYACELLRAARDGGEKPAPKPVNPKIEKPGQYTGVFTAEDGAQIEVAEKNGELKLYNGTLESDMQQVGGNFFACNDEAFVESGLEIEAEEEKPVRVWAGDREFLADPSIGFQPPASPELQALAGFLLQR